MARRGLFGRTLDWLGRHTPVPGRRAPQRATEPPREPPRQYPPGPPRELPERQDIRSGGSGANRYRTVWDADVPNRVVTRIQDDTGFSRNEIFQHHFELFISLPGLADEDRDEQLRLWDIYLESMVVNQERRNDPSNPFWREFGLDPRYNDFDWGEWRDAMGYSRRK